MKSGFPWRFSTPSPTRCRNAGLPPHAAGGLSPGAGLSIPNGPGILDVTAPPRKEELEDAYARYAGSRTLRGKLEKTAFPNTSAPLFLSYPQRHPGRLQNHTKQPSQSILPQFFLQCLLKTRRPAGFAIPSLWHWPFPSICAPGSPRKPCETLSLPCAPALTPH